MKMSKYTVELDIEQVDRIVADELIRCRQSWVNDLMIGGSGVFNWDDQEAENAELQKHIDAVDVILSWYCTDKQLEDYGLSRISTIFPGIDGNDQE
jgi:hypothetical protein